MLVFHGTTDYFTTPITSKGKKFKDFGVGFYLTISQDQAERFAESRKDDVIRRKNCDAIVHAFELDYEKFKSDEFHHRSFDEYNEAWVDFIIENRRNARREKHHPYGTVYGPIADGKAGKLLSQYERKEISKETLLEKLRGYGPTQYQYYFGSQKAINECLIYYTSYVVSATPINIPEIYNSTLPDNIHIKWKFNKKNRYMISDQYTKYVNHSVSISSKPQFSITRTLKDIWPLEKLRITSTEDNEDYRL